MLFDALKKGAETWSGKMILSSDEFQLPPPRYPLAPPITIIPSYSTDSQSLHQSETTPQENN
jgi:hypothetical protein